MTEKIRMIATQKQRFGSANVVPGDPILATPSEAKALIALRRAERAPQVPALLQPPLPAERAEGNYATRVMTADQPRAAAPAAEPPRVKRPYRRHNQASAA